MRPLRPLENAIDWLRFDLPARYDRRVLIGAAAVVLAVIVAALIAINPFGGENGKKVVTLTVATDNSQQAPVGVLGYPLLATRNTTRIPGGDEISDAAAAALATHPPAPGAPPIETAVLVGDDDWQAGIAAAVLAGPPTRAPVLISQDGGVPGATAEALTQLNPRGGGGSDVSVYAAGGASVPGGLSSDKVPGDSPAEIANSFDQLRQRLTRLEPEHIVIASSEEPGYAMPAAAWAARSGDPVLFTGSDRVPSATLTALRRHASAKVYLLGPERAISKRAEQEIGRISSSVRRIGANGVVQNALLFARYTDGSFGWNIAQTPGHGMQIANAARPLDAAAASSLASSGQWGPLLLTDSADVLPPDVRNFLLDIKPGYATDPTQAVYNHVWLMGDATAIGGQVQAEVDELAELAPIGGTGSSSSKSLPGLGTAEGEPAPTAPGKTAPGKAPAPTTTTPSGKP